MHHTICLKYRVLKLVLKLEKRIYIPVELEYLIVDFLKWKSSFKESISNGIFFFFFFFFAATPAAVNQN